MIRLASASDIRTSAFFAKLEMAIDPDNAMSKPDRWTQNHFGQIIREISKFFVHIFQQSKFAHKYFVDIKYLFAHIKRLQCRKFCASLADGSKNGKNIQWYEFSIFLITSPGAIYEIVSSVSTHRTRTLFQVSEMICIEFERN